jgi:hypothetical protein
MQNIKRLSNDVKTTAMSENYVIYINITAIKGL